MTEQTTKRRGLILDRSGTAESIARPMTEEEISQDMLCFVRHEDAGGWCHRPAVMLVYGITMCEVHGTEARAGALSELYSDADEFLERLDNPSVPMPNAEAGHALAQARNNLGAGERIFEDREEALLRLAYPTIPERVCPETTHYDPHDPAPRPGPSDIHLDCRRVIHGLMRRAYLERMDWLVEILEYEREHCSAQAAFALEDYERKVGSPV